MDQSEQSRWIDDLLWLVDAEHFPTVIVVDIYFPDDRRELFSTLSAAVGICSLNISLQSQEKGMSTTTTLGKSSWMSTYKLDA